MSGIDDPQPMKITWAPGLAEKFGIPRVYERPRVDGYSLGDHADVGVHPNLVADALFELMHRMRQAEDAKMMELYRRSLGPPLTPEQQAEHDRIRELDQAWHDAHREAGFRDIAAEFEALLAETTAADPRLGAVVDLHRPEAGATVPDCEGCGDDDEGYAVHTWPCPTIHAIRGDA